MVDGGSGAWHRFRTIATLVRPLRFQYLRFRLSLASLCRHPLLTAPHFPDLLTNATAATFLPTERTAPPNSVVSLVAMLTHSPDDPQPFSLVTRRLLSHTTLLVLATLFFFDCLTISCSAPSVWSVYAILSQ